MFGFTTPQHIVAGRSLGHYIYSRRSETKKSPAPGPQNGGRGWSAPDGPKGAGGGPLAAPTKPPHSALMAAGLTGRRGGGGGVAPEEPTATDTKKWDGGSLPKGPPADACPGVPAGRGQRGGAGSRGAGAQAFSPRLAAICASGGGQPETGEKPTKAAGAMPDARAYR